MVALPTGAYVEGVLVAIEVYRKFATGFRMVGGTESAKMALIRPHIQRPYILRLTKQSWRDATMPWKNYTPP